mmetsp:Transcript_26642/g.53179  ORF Transcript_26642/g.53179 Transcript_26642/m.53179 type:complete len:118 (-) Transcript_26642:147-500(-)
MRKMSSRARDNNNILTCCGQSSIRRTTGNCKQIPNKGLDMARRLITSSQRNGVFFIRDSYVPLRHHPSSQEVNEAGIKEVRDAHAQYDMLCNWKELVFFASMPSENHITDDETGSDH